MRSLSFALVSLIAARALQGAGGLLRRGVVGLADRLYTR